MYNAPAILWGIVSVVKQKQNWELVPLGLMTVITFIIWLSLMSEFRLDDSFITYRYAQNVAQGYGLVYNVGDQTLSTTAPLYALLLATLHFFVRDFHVLGGFIGTISITLGGWLIYLLIPKNISFIMRVWAGIVYILSTPLWLALGMETPLWIMIVLLSTYLVSQDYIIPAGVAMGLNVLIRPDAILPGALLGAVIFIKYFSQERWKNRHLIWYGLCVATPVIFFATWTTITYGSPLPATLSAKNAQASLGITGFGPFTGTLEGLALIAQSLLNQSPFYIVILVLMIIGMFTRINWASWLVIVWGTSHVLAYIILATAPYRWYYAPLIPGIIILSTYGLWHLRTLGLYRKLVYPIITVVALAPLIAQATSFAQIRQQMLYGGPPEAMLPIVDWATYRQVGEWLRDNTPPDATIGVAEVGQVGFYAERWMTDYLGLLQPEVAQMLKRGDLYSWLVGYAPDYLIFQRFRGTPLVLYNYLIGDDPWFIANYAPITEFDDSRYSSGPVTVFERVTEEKNVKNQMAQVDFEGLRLIGLATDGYDLSQKATPVRIRLDWQVIGNLPPDLHIAVKGLDMPQIPAFDGDYKTQHWQGAFSTWHALVIPENISPGGYPLEVSVGPVGGPYSSRIAGRFDVSFPKEDISQTEATFSDDNVLEIGLIGSKLEREQNKLVLVLTWQALRNIENNYSYFIHITQQNGDTPLTQLDNQPLDGSYPTSLWQAGEVIPLSIVIENLPTIPGEYNVLFGWYNSENGKRLKQGLEDTLLLTHLVVE